MAAKQVSDKFFPVKKSALKASDFTPEVNA